MMDSSVLDLSSTDFSDTSSLVSPPPDSSLVSPMQKDFEEYSLSELLLLLLVFFALIAFIARFFKD